ncbi:MAG: hypothetical protein O3A95_06500 [Planctomycetota bacterium]|nr:hypothetical protein [Planctomycetota bacterium]
MRSALKLTALGLMALLPVACGPSGPSANTPGGIGAGANNGAGLGTSDILFSGVLGADAINPNEVTVTWADAVLLPNLGGAISMRYQVFRALDAETAQLDSALVFTTEQGVTSFIDTGLPDNTTLFYRVVALDTDERFSLTAAVASARTPAEYGPGLVAFDTQVLPLWSTPMPGIPATTCLSCHTLPGPGQLDLSTLEGVLAGVGTLQNPNSFVIPYQGEASWAEFLARMSALPTLFQHLPYITDPEGLAAMEEPIKAWIAEGALATPDSAPPVFEFADEELAGTYFGSFVDFDTVSVTFPHAIDPESLPFNGSVAGQLEYAVYAGVDSNSIIWDKPTALITVDLNQAALPTVTGTFDWTLSDSLVVIVRPLDASGRGVPFDLNTYDPETATAQELENFRLRMRNQSSNEREMAIIR